MAVQLPEIDPVKTTEKIAELLQTRLEKLGRNAIVLGLSGGLDSAVVAYMAVRSVGADRVQLMYLPDQDSDRRHQQDARYIANQLNIRLQIQSITPIVRRLGGYSVLPLRFVPTRWMRLKLVGYGRRALDYEAGMEILHQRLAYEADSWIARGNVYSLTKHRARMAVLYRQAELHNWMVVGAANRTEWLTGTFVLWGVDHCADVMPILHLYRSQVLTLASYLGIPARILIKPADPDLIPGLNDKQDLLGPFEAVDNILYALETGVKKKTIYKEYDKETVKRIQSLMNASQHMREAPVNLLND